MSGEVGDDYRGRYERTLRLASALAELTPLAGIAVTEQREVDEALRKLVERAADVMDVAMTSVWRYGDAGSRLECHLSFERAIRAWSSGQVIKATDAPAYFRALLDGQAIPAHDARHDPRTAELVASYLERFEVGALLDAVMPIRGRFGGVLCFEHQGATRRWAPEEIRFAIGVAGIAGVLLDRHDAATTAETTLSPGLRFAQLYDDVPFGLVQFELDGTIRRANPKLAALFAPGTSHTELVGRSLVTLLGPTLPDLIELRARMTTGPVHVEHVRDRQCCDLTFTALRDATGHPAFFACVALDVTLEHAARASLRAIGEVPITTSLEAVARGLAATLGADAVLIGRIQGASVRAEPVVLDGVLQAPFSYPIVGTPCENVVRGGTYACSYPSGALAKFPDDAMLADHQFDSYTGAPLRGRGGEVIGLLAVLSRTPLVPAPAVTEILGAFAKLVEVELQRQDTAAETATQRQFLQHIVDHISEVFWIATWPAREILYMTPGAEAITGRTVAEIMGGSRQLRDLIHPSDIVDLEALLATGRDDLELVHRVPRPDGAQRWIKSRIFFIRTAGQPMKLAGVSEDITRERAADEALRSSTQRMADLLRRGDQEVVRLEHQLGEGSRLGGLLGSSQMMRDVFRRLRQAAEADVTVLITGESGTGKELAAAAIHELGARRGKPFVALNCAAIPETLLESELFGYAKGAFTGASRDKIGLMQAAHGGTLFLDEIGDMGPSLQVKVLRAFQQREIRRLGDDRPIAIDIRMISATHRDLRALVAAGQLREDFFYRIRVFEIEMPPLRSRPDDIPLLASHFAAELGKLAGKPHLAIASDAMQRLLQHDWPGNVRELRNAIEHAMVSAERATIQVADLPPELRPSATASDREEIIPVDMRVAIDDALRRSGGNRTEAARLLGISRVTLWKRMRRLGHVVEDEAE